VGQTTWILIISTIGLSLALLAYKITTIIGLSRQGAEEPGRQVRGIGRERLRLERAERIVRLIMQVFITIVGLGICVMILFDGCYGWLGWCEDPASEGAKNWAAGIVGTVVGFWLTKV
jgi:hypothetical protein